VDGGVPQLARHIDRIYQAAIAPECWRAFLESLAEELRARTLHLSFRLPRDGDRGVVFSLGMDESFVSAYRTHFHLIDPWMPSLGAERAGEVHGLEEFISDGQLERTAFYDDWMRPQGIFYAFGAFLRKSGSRDLVSSLSGFRDRGSGPFRKEELDRIRPLVPHLQRALVIHDRVHAAELRAGAAADALDRIVGGVVLLDERGDTLVTNRSADRILAENDGLVLDRGGPRAATREQTGELRRLVAEASDTRAGKGEKAAAVLRLVRPSGRPALEAVVAPICPESSSLFHERATAAIFVSESGAQSERPVARLRRIYGLTPAAAEVASRLVQGMRLPAISEDLGISIHTVRGHLKQLFARTGTHRQAELIRVLLAGPGRIRLD
jgi:DNA-binding CsgD family transcriptional regulator